MAEDMLTLEEILLIADKSTDIQREESEFRKGSGRKVITYRARYKDLYIFIMSHPYPGYESMYELTVLLGTCKVAEYVHYHDGKSQEGKSSGSVLEAYRKLEEKYLPVDRDAALRSARQIIEDFE